MTRPRLDVASGIVLWPRYFAPGEQEALLDEVQARLAKAPFYRPSMPKSGAPFSVLMTNFGSLGWFSDRKGYRYEAHHPVTGETWPDIPPVLLRLWDDLTCYPAQPEACLVNLYRGSARRGAHRDADENASDAPVLSVSLGDTALFRIGGARRQDPSRKFRLASGDVLMFGGPARLAYHGVDRIVPDSSGLIPEGGRINLTLRRVTPR